MGELAELEDDTRAAQPCGHPAACIVSSREGTNYCGWCADVDYLMGCAMQFARDLADVRSERRVLRNQLAIAKRALNDALALVALLRRELKEQSDRADYAEWEAANTTAEVVRD